MRNLIKNFNNTFFNPCKYNTFLTIDNNFISGLIYKNNNKEFKENNIICTCNIKVGGIDLNNIYSKTEFANSIAKCIDILEDKANIRIKSVILSLVGFNSKSIFYPLHLKGIKNIDLHNLINHINPKEMGFYLGNDYILTNLLPLNIKDDTNNKLINFLIAGFKRDCIFQILDIFYNLSLNIDNILFAPLLLPYSLKDSDQSIMVISSSYTLLHSKNTVEMIPFGTNYILESISKRTLIPYSSLLKYSSIIKELLIIKEETLLYKIDDFVVKDINQVITNSLNDYLIELKHLITRKNLHKHGKIIIINNNFKFFKEQKLLSYLDTLDIEFSDITSNKSFINLEISISEILNKAAIKYHINNMVIDLALENFNKRINRILEHYRY